MQDSTYSRVSLVCAHKETEKAAMLILTRRVGETVMVGQDVTFTVLGVKGGAGQSWD